MKNIFKILICSLLMVSFSCQESENTIDDVLDYETGAILRTLSVENALFNSSDNSTAFVVTVEEQDEQDGGLLESVDVYVSLRDLTGGTTVAIDKYVKTYDASVFTTSAVGLPQATISANYGETFAALGVGADGVEPGDIFQMELRLNLTDGRTFGKSSAAGIITGGFFSSPFVYNALITCSPASGDYTVEMHDSYGDGWQTNAGSGGDGISIDIDGTIVMMGMCSPYGGAAGTFLESGAGTGCVENNGYDATGIVNIPVGTSSATWSWPGDAYGEISFEVYGPGGEELYVGAQGETATGLLPITLCASN